MIERKVNNEFAMGIAAAVQKRTFDDIRQEYGWLPWRSLHPADSAAELILELRVEGLTLSCFFNEKEGCCGLSYLFPDTEKELAACVSSCHRHYCFIAENLWIDYSYTIIIRLLHDAEIGQLLAFEAVD